jgi:histidinol dehydrogenase
MQVLRYRDRDFENRVRALSAASSLFDPLVEDRTRTIVEAVRARGDAALLEFTKRFDGASLQADQLPVTTAEILAASIKADTRLRSAVATADRNVAAFARKSLRAAWTMRNAQGGQVGEKFDPFRRVGVYVPGGAAPLVSTALMTVTLARVAGCPQIAVCTPCGPDGGINPALLYAVRAAGATEVYRVGGAQAIAALACGTQTIAPVQKIFGPGNAYVVAAKRLLFGRVAIDLLPGPSELLVLADETAEPGFIAADLLAQAEHGSGHERVWLVTPAGELIRRVQAEVRRQLPKRPRRALIERALDANGWIIQVKGIDAGVDLANHLAPEHCEILTRHPAAVARRLVTAGALFLGGYSPTVLGDYMAGPSHTLPTGGAGASFAGLTVDQFQRRTSVVAYSRPALARSLATIRTFADMEGLEAHGHSAAVRLEPAPSDRRRVNRARSSRPD